MGSESLEPLGTRAAASQDPDSAARRSGRSEGKLRSPRGQIDDLAFLVPGLLGFEHFSTFGYFADRVSAALRAGLEQHWEKAVAVLPVPIPPTASLAERQRRLVKTLADRMEALGYRGEDLRIHLVGHSTGGVDAQLLTAETPLVASRWSEVDPRAPRVLACIASVVTLGSPHQGACITRDPVARLVSERRWRGLPDLAALLTKFFWSTARDIDLGTFVTSSLREGGKVARFLLDIFAEWELIADLQPTRDPASATYRTEIRRRSFVTLSGQPKGESSAVRPADAFYSDLAARASGKLTGCARLGRHIDASVEALRRILTAPDAESRIIRNPGAELPPQIDAEHNDGVVNSVRQLMDPSHPNEIEAIVVGDHFDVLGYYDRRVWKTDAQGREQQLPVLAGLLHSGSGFGDDEFFTLYRRIAKVIASAADRRS